jgi:hypothetical protein
MFQHPLERTESNVGVIIYIADVTVLEECCGKQN